MKEIMEGKKRLTSKIIAILLSLAMILSVMYVSNKDNDVSAAGDGSVVAIASPAIEVSELSEDVNLSNEITIQIYVDAVISFDCGKIKRGTGLDSCNLAYVYAGTLYNEGSSAIDINLNSTDSDEKEIKIYATNTELLDITEASALTPSVILKFVYKGTDSDKTLLNMAVEPKNSVYDADNKLLKISTSIDKQCIDGTGTITANENKTLYYGAVYYNAKPESGDLDEAEWSTNPEIPIKTSGRYMPYAVFRLGDTEISNRMSNATVLCDSEPPVLTYQNMIENDAHGSASSTGTGSVITGAYYTDEYEFEFISSEAGNVYLYKNAETSPVSKKSVSANTIFTVTVPAAAENDAGSTITYKVVADDASGNKSEEYEITVSYLNNAITVSDIKVNDKDVLDGGSTAVNQDISLTCTAESEAGIKSVSLYKCNDDGSKGDKVADLTAGTAAGTYTYVLNQPVDGNYSYFIVAENNSGKNKEAKISITVDSKGPELVSVKFDGTDVAEGSNLNQKLSTVKHASSVVALSAEDALSNIKNVEVYAKLSDGTTSNKQAVTISENSKTFNGEIPVSDFHNGFTDEQLKGNTVTYYVEFQDVLSNSTTKELFRAVYYKDNIDVTEVTIGNLSKNPIGVVIETATEIADFSYNDELGILTNAASYEVQFRITSDIKLEASDVILKTDGLNTVLDASGNLLKPAEFTESKDPDTGDYIYTGKFIPSTIFGTVDTVTYTVTATNINGASDTEEATILFIDTKKPEAAENEKKSDAENTIDSTTWYRNLTVIYRVSDEAETGSIASGLGENSVEVTQDNGTTYMPVAGNNGLYSVTVKQSADKNGTNIRLKVTDQAGNIAYYPSENNYYIYHVDNEAPIVSLSVSDSKGNEMTDGMKVSGSPVITYHVSDNLYLEAEVKVTYKGETDDVTDIYVSSDDKKWTELVKEDTVSLEAILKDKNKELKDGEYTVTVNVKDTIASAVPVTFTFRVDNTEPVITKVYVKENDAAGFTEYSLDEFQQYIKRDICPKKLVIKLEAKDEGGAISRIAVSQNGSEAKKFAGNVTDEIVIEPSQTESGTSIHVEVFDRNDNDDNNMKSYNWNILVDNQPPKVNWSVNDSDYKNNDSVLNGNPEIVVTDSDNIRVVSRRMTIVTPKDTINIEDSRYLNGKKLSELIGRTPEDGKYTITVSATDRAGVKTEKSFAFTIDNTVPDNTMKITTAAPAKIGKYSRTDYAGNKYGQYYNTNVTLAYSVTDKNLKEVTVKDNGKVIAGGASGTVTISEEGTHTIILGSKDKAGNPGENRSFTFTIDKTAPVISTTLNGIHYANDSGVRYLRTDGLLTVGADDENMDTDDFTRIEKMTPPSQTTQTNTAKIAEGSATYSTEADYEISYRAVDRAGNESEVRTVQFRVDKTAPELTISGIADGGTSTKNVTVTYGMKEDFYWDMAIAKINVYKGIDGQSEKLLKTVEYNAKNANSTMTETFSEDGDYRFEFIAEDRAGNTANKSYSFILDGTAPVIALSGVKNYDKTDDKVVLTISITEDFYTSNKLELKGTVTGIDGKKKNIDFGNYTVNNSKISNIIQQFTEDGVYDIEATSTDKAGNTSTEKIHFTIDTKAPVISDLSAYDGTIMNRFIWNYTNEDIVSDLTVCDVIVYLDGVEYDGLNEVEDGKHVLRIVATDEMGHSVEKQVEFLLDTIAPNVIITGVEDGDRLLESTEINVSLQIEGDILDSVILNGKEQQISNNTSTFTVDKAGSYELIVKAHDEAGNTIEKVIHFEYGKKFNLWWILLIILLLLILVMIIILVKKNKKDKKQQK